MSDRDDGLYVHHILDAISLIGDFLVGKSQERFFQDPLLQSGVAYQLQIIGEAAAHLSSAFLIQHADMPWGDIIAMRHKIVHDYSGLDVEVLWTTVAEDLPSLKDHLSP